MLRVPNRQQAEAFIREAEIMNPGPWIPHSLYAAQAAEAIARYHPALDPDAAFVMGYLHDIGRRAGIHGMRHMIDGHAFLAAQGFEDAARICITHSYIIKEIDSVVGERDCTNQELEFMHRFLAGCVYDEYDRLIQLSDTISEPSGFCLIEKRLVDVALRYGINDYSLQRWQAYLDIQKHFEKSMGRSIYSLLPGVAGNTLGASQGVD